MSNLRIAPVVVLVGSACGGSSDAGHGIPDASDVNSSDAAGTSSGESESSPSTGVQKSEADSGSKEGETDGSQPVSDASKKSVTDGSQPESDAEGTPDAEFPSPFIHEDSGSGSTCPPAQQCYGACCDTGAVCIDTGVAKTCARSCTDVFGCTADTDCCTLLSDGSGACLPVGVSGPLPGQQCLCTVGTSGGCAASRPVCAPAKDNLGNPTGPNVCMSQ